MTVRGDELLAGRRRHQPVGLQEFYHQLIETARIFDAAGVPGLGQNLVDGSGDQRCGFLAGGKRVIVFTVDNQCGYLHRSEPGGHVGSAAGTKNLPDGFSIEPGISFDKGVEKIFAQFGFRKIRSNEFLQDAGYDKSRCRFSCSRECVPQCFRRRRCFHPRGSKL